MVFDGRAHHPTIEGPKFYKRNGYYYIFAPAGGVATGWQTVLRSRNILGPYEDKIVMDRGHTQINGPHQGGWVELRSGESWFLHFQDRGVVGRVVHLQPLKWTNDWPVIGVDADADGKGQPVTEYRKPNVGRAYPIEVPQTSDEFTGRKLGLQWQWHANSRDDWYSLSARSGWLRLFATSQRPNENLWAASNLLLQKLPAPAFTITTRVDTSQLREGERAGLVMMGRDYSYIVVLRASAGLQLVRMTSADAAKQAAETEGASTAATTDNVFLRVTVRNEKSCRFSFSFDGKKFQELGTEFVAREGVWIGAKVGLFAIGPNAGSARGFVDLDWFRVE